MSKRPWVIFVCIVALVAAVWIGAFSCTGSASETGFPDEVHALSSGGAIVRWIHPPRIGRLDSRGRLLWHHAIPGKDPLRDAIAVSIEDAVVVARYGTKSQPRENRAIAFSLDGKRLWDQRLTAYESDDGYETVFPNSPFGFVPTVDDHVLSLLVDTGSGWSAIAMDVRSGHVHSVAPANPSMQSMSRLGDMTVFGDDSLMRWRDVQRGTDRDATGPKTGSSCFTGKEIVAWQLETHRLTAITSPTTERVLAAPFAVEGDTMGYVQLVACGRYGDQIVLYLEHSAKDHQRTSRVVILDEHRRTLKSIALGGRAPIDLSSIQERYPGRGSFQGDLTRFVPVVTTSDIEDTITHRMIMVDLEQGTIAWQGAHDPSMQHRGLFRHGVRWYWSRGFLPNSVTLFDGTTGKLQRSVVVHHYNGIVDFEPSAITDDTLWFVSQEATPLGAIKLALLDAATLETRLVTGDQWTIEDKTDATRRRLRLK